MKHKAFKYLFSSLNWFHCIYWFRKPLKVSKLTVLGHIVQVLLQYKVGVTPDLGSKFREVSAAGVILTIEEVSASRATRTGLTRFNAF